MIKQVSYLFKVSLLAIMLSLGIGYAIAWTAPTTNPPNGNVSAPINTGSTDQTKAGDLCTSKGGTTKCLSSAQLAGPVITFYVTPSSGTIQHGQSASISWKATNVNATPTPCDASGSWSGSKVASSTSAFPTGALDGTGGPITFTYTLSCTGPGGTVSASSQIQVLAPYEYTPPVGTGNWIGVPSAVTSIKFKAQGGRGMSGGGSVPCGGTGGSASFAYYGSRIPIVVAGGGGGAACTMGSSLGGYTGGDIHGAGGAGWSAGGPGASGNTTTGGKGGDASTAVGGNGGSNVTGAVGSNGTSELSGSMGCSASNVLTTNGGNGLTGDGIGGTNGGSCSGGGGGGGLGGGGGGGVKTSGGGGGGGSGYIITGATGPDAGGFITVPISAIPGGNPGSIYLRSGAGGGSAAAGYITVRW